MKSVDMYSVTVENLKRAVEMHETESGRSSVKAFCETYGFSRQNMVEVLNQKQEMSVHLFIRIEAALAKRPAPAMPDGVERWSLRTWLQMQQVNVHQAMYNVNFGDY
jgi:hypothetical protein